MNKVLGETKRLRIASPQDCPSVAGKNKVANGIATYGLSAETRMNKGDYDAGT
jgi:hypothetical protein